MPLQLPAAPPNAYALVTAAISRLSFSGGAAANLVTRVADPSRLSAAVQHQVYLLSAADIAAGRNLDKARLVAWRFLIQYGSKIIGAVELACDAQGSNLKFANLDAGPFAQGTYNVVARAEGLDAVIHGAYELRLLKAPSVYTVAVWLKNLKGGSDIVLPVPDSPAAAAKAAMLGGAPALDAGNFVGSLKAPALQALRFDSRPRPDGGAPGGARPVRR